MGILKEFLSSKRRPLNQQHVNFENDPLRFIFDALLAEYEKIRNEIEIRTELQERTVNYLTLILAALISATQLFPDVINPVVDLLKSNPLIYLILAFISSYLPLSTYTQNQYIVMLASYNHEILSPKLNEIIRVAGNSSPSIMAYSTWEKENYVSSYKGVMRWDAYFIGRRRPYRFLALLGFVRYVYVSTPLILFLYSFTYATDECSILRLFAYGIDTVFLILVVRLGLSAVTNRHSE